MEPHTAFLPDEETAFLARVQLSNGSKYDDFHERMAEQGFSQTIKNLSGETKQLPDATYFISGLPERTGPQAVFDRAKKAVVKHKELSDQMNIKEHIIVVKASDVWFDLEDHEEKPD
ncbi:hypothetical protein V0R55_15215 [Pseudomonas soli]|uniref:BRCT domain-containing protein n=1 Tax=Pseudomonas soli TaxID=1306993 RepID=A0ABU7GRH8_9PSED|nr:hypothetical protein [Pseudomonas soli]MEE1881516.1 hypothetical protein [Pseudomonas soli]